MFEWRVSKYLPQHRRPDGTYAREEWTSAHDIGASFDGRVLTIDEYLRVEASYVEVVARFHAEAGAPELRARDVSAGPEPLSLPGEALTSPLAEGQIVSLEMLRPAIRSCLRENVWCRLEATDGSFAVHFGYDYYVYVITATEAAGARRFAAEQGLVVEPFASPYEKREPT